MAKIIDGKAIASTITDNIARASADFQSQIGIAPCLAVVLVGEDPASAIYVRNKGRTAEKVGFRSIQTTLPADTPQGDLVQLIRQYNDDPSIHGILVQLPLPPHLNAAEILDLISPAKDVDGFHPINVGRLASGAVDSALVPCTPAGSVILAKSVHGADMTGLHAVVLGRSNIVGKPAAQLFLQANCTVTIAHSKTKDIAGLSRDADILIAAVGRANFVSGDWIKPGATVIDVGINRLEDDKTKTTDAQRSTSSKSKIVGDVDFAAACEIAGAITPVPGGVGPMTIAMLIANTLTAACRQNKQPDPVLA
ncbi:MAG: bifunctional methylenetetrahydrofolate dehydrogenase/methenyltetrahydrofolate cyclohydrolase FolD [Pseudomonadota bacterium]